MLGMKLDIRGAKELAAKFKRSREIIAKEKRNAISEIIHLIERRSKSHLPPGAPVDTNRLRSAIMSQIGESRGVLYVLDNVDYAVFVHEGTYKMKARPFFD